MPRPVSGFGDWQHAGNWDRTKEPPAVMRAVTDCLHAQMCCEQLLCLLQCACKPVWCSANLCCQHECLRLVGTFNECMQFCFSNPAKIPSWQDSLSPAGPATAPTPSCPECCSHVCWVPKLTCRQGTPEATVAWTCLLQGKAPQLHVQHNGMTQSTYALTAVVCLLAQ
jgi:hypothetical protein